MEPHQTPPEPPLIADYVAICHRCTKPVEGRGISRDDWLYCSERCADYVRPEGTPDYERAKDVITAALSPGRYTWTNSAGVVVAFTREELAYVAARSLFVAGLLNDGKESADER